MYSEKNFLSDIAGYGSILAAYVNSTPICVGDERTPLPLQNDDDIDAFAKRMYGYITVRAGITVYRWFDDGEGYFLGRWWSPRRPAAEIDALGLQAEHRRSRHELAMKTKWNEMNEVLEADLRPGTKVVAGRAAQQFEGSKMLGGGAIQFLIPLGSRGGLDLKRTYPNR